MGLTCSSCRKKAFCDIANVKIHSQDEIIVALAGNPNTGKSTVFNALTGLKQHTGNWPGKTVVNAQGKYKYKDKTFIVVDLPGTYSLLANSVEEQIARDFICFGGAAATVVVADCTCLERNLNLVFQVMEITNNVILCLNLIDEARRKNIKIDINTLSDELGIPIVPTVARNKEGLDNLIKTIYNVTTGALKPNPKKITYDNEIEDKIRKLEDKIKPLVKNKINSRWIALRILEGDLGLVSKIQNFVQNN